MSSAKPPTATPAPTTTARGRAAEQLAADYLAARGLVILDRNWRNRWCELDIVARAGGPGGPYGPTGIVHFVEVKYRATTAYGLPAEYITRDKIGRLTRAALAWNQAHRYVGSYQIDIISITGRLTSPVIEFLPNAISG